MSRENLTGLPALLNYHNKHRTNGAAHCSAECAPDILAAQEPTGVSIDGVAAYRADLRARILAAGLFGSCGGYGCWEGRNDDLGAVLAEIDQEPT